ncbi:MAG: hypothetical protein HY040_23335 [Planctomycetes bacterium]|nr:hypothetical protein [Planctomycetota bacterium]
MQFLSPSMDRAALADGSRLNVKRLNVKRTWIPNACALVVVALILVNYVGPFADLDWSWQVRTGGAIVASGSPRVPESFSYTIPGVVVPDFEWLYEVILWVAWSGFGMGGLKLLKVLLVATPLILVARQLQCEGVRWHGIAVSLCLAIFVLSPAWNLRPLFCTTTGLLLLTSMLHNHTTGKKPLSWWLPLGMLLWANLHPGVIVGQGLLLGAIGWECLNRWLRWNSPLDQSRLRRFMVIGGLGLAATFVSPDPFERLRYPFKPELAHPIMRIFAEMQPLYSFLDKPPYAIGLIYVVAALVLMTIILRFRHYRMWEIALLGGLAFLGNFAYRSAMDWLLVMLMLGVPHLKELFAEAARRDRRRTWTKALLRLDCRIKSTLASSLLCWRPLWPALALGTLLVVSLIPPLSRRMPIQDAAEWPVAAVDHIEKAGWSGNFFAPPDYGAYLGWRLGDRCKIYTDTRGFFFPPELLEDSHFIPQLGPDWRRRLDRVLEEYRTDYFLLETEGPRAELWNVLRPNVKMPLYLDDQAVLLTAEQVRRGLNPN